MQKVKKTFPQFVHIELHTHIELQAVCNRVQTVIYDTAELNSHASLDQTVGTKSNEILLF